MPQNNDRDGGSGFLKAAAVATPLGIGVGIGVRDMLRTTQINPRESAIQEMQSKVAPFSSKLAANTVDVSTHLAFMNQQFTGGQDGNVAKSAWQSAISSVDPITRRQLRDFTGNIGTMSDEEAVSAITRTMENNKSLMMRNVYNRFMRNVQTIQGQQILHGGAIPTFKDIVAEESPYLRRTLSTNIQERLERIAPKSFYQFQSTPELAEQGLGVVKLSLGGLPGGSVEVDMPLTAGGRLVEGATMQTQRIAPPVWVVRDGQVVDKMSREEFFLEQFEKSIVPDIESGHLSSHREIQKAVSELRQEVFTEFESSAVVPEEDTFAASRQRTMLREQQVQLLVERQRKTEGKTGFVSAYRAPTPEEYQKIMLKSQMTPDPLFGGISPTAVSRGMASRYNISRLFPFGEVKDWGRRPEQAFREYQLTQDSVEKLKEIQGDRFFRYQALQSETQRQLINAVQTETAGRLGEPLTPSLGAVFVDPEAAGNRELLERLNMKSGHGVMRKDVGRALEFEAPQHMSLKQLTPEMEAMIDKGSFTAQQGQILGTDEAGNIIAAQKNMEIFSVEAKSSEAKGSFARLIYRDIHQVSHGDKFFGGDKATMLMKSQQQINRATNNDKIFQGAETIINAEVLKKDRQLYRQQLVSGLEGTLGEGRTPYNIGEQWAQAAGMDDIAFTRQAMTTALESDMGAERFGEVFGVAPAVIGREEAKSLVEEVGGAAGRNVDDLYRQVSRGRAVGMTTLTFDSPPAMKGAGTALGSIEPRILEAFRDPHWGTLGEDVSEELTSRLIQTDPEAYKTYKELSRTFASLAGEDVAPADISSRRIFEAKDYPDRNFTNWLSTLGEEGGYIRQGKGLTDIYVPGPEQVNKLREFTTASGKDVSGDLSKIYQNMAENASQMYSDVGQISQKEVLENLQQYEDELAYHWAPGGKGMGSYTRGKIGGSRFLRMQAVSEAGDTISDLSQAGITENMFNKMTEEMEGLYDPSELAEMRSRFGAGGTIGGLVGRHPFTSPLSMQPMLFRKVAGRDDQIVLPEKTIDVELATGERRPLTIGPSVAMGGDFDADNAAAYLISPKNEKNIRNMMVNGNNAYTSANIRHQVRFGLLGGGKAHTAGAEVMSIAEKMSADVRKIGTTQTHVPTLSTEMTRARAALGRFGKGQSAEDAKMLLTWLEETPISAKHISAGEVSRGGIDDMMERIRTSMQMRDASSLRSVVKDITAGNELSQRLLTEDIQLSERSARDLSRAYGENVATTQRGAHIDEATNELMRVMEEARTSGAEREHRVMTGRASRVKPSEIIGAIKTNKVGGFANVSRMATTASNMLGAAGRGIIRNKKPIGWGFAGALAISAALSSPKETIGPGSGLGPKVKPRMSEGKAAQRLKPEDMMPPSQGVGQPSTPNLLAQQQVRLGSTQPSQRINVSARVGSMTNASELSGRITNMTNRSTSINIRDNRENLSSHRIANNLL